MVTKKDLEFRVRAWKRQYALLAYRNEKEKKELFRRFKKILDWEWRKEPTDKNMVLDKLKKEFKI